MSDLARINRAVVYSGYRVSPSRHSATASSTRPALRYRSARGAKARERGSRASRSSCRRTAAAVAGSSAGIALLLYEPTDFVVNAAFDPASSGGLDLSQD